MCFPLSVACIAVENAVAFQGKATSVTTSIRSGAEHPSRSQVQSRMKEIRPISSIMAFLRTRVLTFNIPLPLHGEWTGATRARKPANILLRRA